MEEVKELYYTPEVEEIHPGFEYELTGGARHFKEGDSVMEYSLGWKTELHPPERSFVVMKSIIWQRTRHMPVFF